MVCGEAEDAGGLSPVKDDNEVTRHFIRRTLPILNCVDYISPAGDLQDVLDRNFKRSRHLFRREVIPKTQNHTSFSFCASFSTASRVSVFGYIVVMNLRNLFLIEKCDHDVRNLLLTEYEKWSYIQYNTVSTRANHDFSPYITTYNNFFGKQKVAVPYGTATSLIGGINLSLQEVEETLEDDSGLGAGSGGGRIKIVRALALDQAVRYRPSHRVC